MRMRTLALAVLLGLATHAAVADDAKPVWTKLAGNYGWDYMKPKTKCAKVTDALVTKMKKYECTVPDPGSTASGKDAVADCKNKSGDDGYLFFAKLADCQKERDTQLANGGGA